jgi:uncharacterized membrane protein
MLRQTIAKKVKKNNPEFHLRGHEVKRIEAFSDAVFAFAVTLLIVSLEVPKSFEELLVTMRGFFAFGICFFLLMLIWFEQNTFFRRYGLHDTWTITLNCILIFLVLFYVYPLKFLFTLMFRTQIYGTGNSPLHLTAQDEPELMFIYGMGFVLIYFVFFLMYMHALRKRNELELTPVEQFDTKTKMFAHTVLISVGVLSVIVSQLLPPASAGSAGGVYFLIGPTVSLLHGVRRRKRRKLYEGVK